MDLEIWLSARDHPQERLYTQSTAGIFSEAGQLGRLIPNNKRVGSFRKRSQPSKATDDEYGGNDGCDGRNDINCLNVVKRIKATGAGAIIEYKIAEDSWWFLFVVVVVVVVC